MKHISLKMVKKVIPKIGSSQHLTAAVVIVMVAGVGTYFLTSSHAETPFVTAAASKGILAGACTKTDSAASSGVYVQFGNCSSGSGGGGTGTGGGSGGGVAVAGESKTCEFLTAPGTAPAFCDNFTNETPASYSARSGPLSPVWGVSRLSDNNNAGQGVADRWAGVSPGDQNDEPTAGNGLCGPLAVGDVINSDMTIHCPGTPGLVETSNDGANDSQTILALYPRQPFDIAGRTGTAVFDATVNSQGMHAAWPTWVYTNEPVPTPTSILPPLDGANNATANARSSVGVDFGNACNNTSCPYWGPDAGPDAGKGFNMPPNFDIQANGAYCETVSDIWVTVNYVPSYLTMNTDGCVRPSTIATTCYPSYPTAFGTNGDPGPVPGCTPGSPIAGTGMDHFEIQINSQGIYIYGQNYDQKTATGQYQAPYLIADAEWNQAGNPSLPLTRGLTWMEDVHYNGDKFNHQAENAIEWDNFGFDGPVLPRDLAYDVPDNTQGDCTPANASTADCLSGNNYPMVDLGWFIPSPGNGDQSFTINNVSTANAGGALIVFNWWPTSLNGSAIMRVSVNGNAPINCEDLNTPSYTDGATGSIIVPLSEIRNGTNTLSFTTANTTDNISIANIDLILLGAGGTFHP